ncbi:MAG: c-type cytochrome domain-containing protein [Bryobacteraceae bacterium]
MTPPFLLTALFLLGVCLSAQTSFYRDIRPLLQKQCQGCHHPAGASSDLDVTTFAAFAKGGKRGPAFMAGKPDESITIRYLNGALQPRMPLGQPEMAAADIDRFRSWIAAGAVDDSPAVISDTGPSVYLQPPVITALRWSPDGQRIAVSGNREVLVHLADGSKLVQRLAGKAERILSIAFSADGNTLIAGGGTPAQFGEVQIWDARTGKQLHAATLTNDTVFGASIAPDGSRVAVGCTDNTVHVFETATGKELYKIGNHENWVLASIFGVDSKRFVSVSKDRAAKLIDAASGAFLENVNLLRSELNAVARHPKKDVVVLGGEDRYPYIYNMDRPKNMKIADDTTLIRKLDRQDGPIFALDWSSDAARIAVAGIAPSVNIYDADSGKLSAECKGHSAGIYAAAFSPDGKKLATGGFDGKLRIYDAANCQLLTGFIPVPLSAGTPAGGAQ